MPNHPSASAVRFVDCSPVWLDFETFYDSQEGYTLKKLTNEAYVRDDRFEAMVLSYKLHPKNPTQVVHGEQAIRQVLASIDWSRSILIAHNTVFDGSILEWRFGHKPAYLLCSMSLWRALLGMRYRSALAVCAEVMGYVAKGDTVAKMDGLHLSDLQPYQLQEYLTYCTHDTELCFQLTMAMMPHFTLSELHNLHASLRMYTQSVLVLDKAVLLEAQDDEQRRRANIYSIGAHHLGLPPTQKSADLVKKIVGSTPKFAELLTAMGVTVPMKQTEHKIKGTDKKEKVWVPAFAKTDAEFEALLEAEDPMIADLCEARLISKSTQGESRIARFLGIESRGTLPFPIQYAGANVTQRWSAMAGINLQNIKNGSPLRKAICAPKGYKIVGGDLSQIELRMGWWIAGEHDKLAKFATGKFDPYKQSMVDTFGLEYEGMSKADRTVGKIIQLSGIYGVGWENMQKIVRLQARRVITEEEAKKIVRIYREDHTYVRNAWSEGQEALDALLTKRPIKIWHNDVGDVRAPTDDLLNKHGCIMRPSGLRIQYPQLSKRKGQWPDGRPKDEYIYIRQRERGGAPTVEFIYGSKAYQNFVQAMARDVIAHAISATVETLPSHWYLVGQVHDELWLIVPDEDTAIAPQYLSNTLTQRPAWCADLPLACETFIAQNYGEGK
jgi:hypothetical protein